MWGFSSRRKDPPKDDGGNGAGGNGTGGGGPKANGGGAPADSLDAIVNGVLQALTDAQQGADRTSASLAGAYLSDPVLSGFKVPNAVIDSVDLTLSFAIRKTETAMETVSGKPMFKQDRLKEVCDAAAQRSADALTSLMKGAMKTASADGTPADKEDRARAEVAEEAGSPDFVDWLSGEMFDAVREQRTSLIDAEGMVDTYKVEQVLQEVIRRNLAAHPDVVDLLPPGIDRKTLRPDLDGVAAPLAHATVTPVSSRSNTQVEVIVDAETLATMPKQAIQSLTMTLRMRDLRWVSDDEQGDKHLVIEE